MKTENKQYGYARVSTRDQNLDRQLLALRDFGVGARYIYADKASGKDFDRPEYKKLVRKLCAGDTLVIKSIDRLGRNYDEILAQWHYLSIEPHVQIVVLDMPLLDTRSRSTDLTNELIVDIVLQLMSYVAQIERENIKSRQAEGIAAAKARGIRFGRPALALPDNFCEVFALWDAGSISSRQATC